MAKVGHGTIILFFAAIMVSVDEAIGARSGHLKEYKPVIKTIKSKYGDIFDCVDIYKQPAFDHPSLKNHIIQMTPSDYTLDMEMLDSITPNPLLWQESESCPEGTIPIQRIQRSDLLEEKSLKRFGLKAAASGIERAGVVSKFDEYYGVQATLNVWNSHVEIDETAASAIFLLSPQDFISVGWIVDNRIYGDQKTRFYTVWSRDQGNTTGCYDLRCPGFVQVNKQIPLGAYIDGVSTYNGQQKQITLQVNLDLDSNNWWLYYGTIPVGYWPTSIFANMAFSNQLDIEGLVQNTAKAGHHTTTQMGSGHFPKEGFKKAAYTSNVLYMDKNRQNHELRYYAKVLTRPECYDVSLESQTKGFSFFYGGPGYDGNKCT